MTVMWPFMAFTVEDDAPAIAKQYLVNVDAAFVAAREAGLDFYLACALMEKETKWKTAPGGSNIYGHDVGGVFSGPGIKYVTKANFAEFERRVAAGERSNGVGPVQLTHRSFFPDLRKRGLEGHVPHDTMLYGFELFKDYMDRARREHPGNEVRWAGTWYNAGPGATQLRQPYADLMANLAETWKHRLG